MVSASFLSRMTRVADEKRSAILLETSPQTMVVMNAMRASPHAESAARETKCSTRQSSLCGEESGCAAANQSCRVAKVTLTDSESESRGERRAIIVPKVGL